MRDEAHRFSRKLHHKQENKRTFHSWLDDIHGIGEETKKQILKNLTVSKEEISKWNIKTIQDYLGINAKLAKAIYDYLRAV